MARPTAAKVRLLKEYLIQEQSEAMPIVPGQQVKNLQQK